jgi:hypothetical protein
MRIKVAITGTLSKPRKEIAALINACSNAEWVASVTYDTNYLVASRFDTGKAKHAAQIGVTVITESEMMEYIHGGSFPPNQRPTRPPQRMPDFKTDEIVWTETYDPKPFRLLEYCDNGGVITERFVFLAGKGVGSNGHEYLGAFDGEKFKTFRADRVRKIEELQPLSEPCLSSL